MRTKCQGEAKSQEKIEVREVIAFIRAEMFLAISSPATISCQILFLRCYNKVIEGSIFKGSHQVEQMGNAVVFLVSH